MWGDYAWVMENQYTRAAVVLVLAFIFAKLFQKICVSVFRRITQKTKTDIDDMILDISARPFFYLILLVGLWVAELQLQILEPYAAIRDGLFFVAAILVISWVLARILVLLTTRWFVSHRNLKGSPKLVNIIVSTTVYIAAGIIILSFFNIEVTPLVAALGVGGLAIGLALQDTLGNFFAGIHIISDEPIRVHDIVEIHGQNVAGEVTDIGWRSTRIRTFKGNSVIVPNSTIASSILTNFELPNTPMKVTVECGVDYGTDLYKVEKLALQVGREIQKTVEGANPDYEPIFRYHTFGDSNIDFKVVLQGNSRGDTFFVQSEFVKALHAAFDKAGIEISWPIRKQYVVGKMPTEKVYKKVPKLKKPSKKSKKREDEE